MVFQLNVGPEPKHTQQGLREGSSHEAMMFKFYVAANGRKVQTIGTVIRMMSIKVCRFAD
jgi:hypothetical protein